MQTSLLSEWRAVAPQGASIFLLHEVYLSLRYFPRKPLPLLSPNDTAPYLKSSGAHSDQIFSVQLRSAGNVKEFTKR